MTTTLPFFGGRLMRLPPASYVEAAPVSAYRALALRSNLQFLCDLFPQTRICWVSSAQMLESAPRDNVYLSASGSDILFLWQQEFEHTWLQPTWPTGLDIEVTIDHASGASNINAVVRIVPASAPVNDLSVEPFYAEAFSTSGVATHTFTAQVFPSANVDQRGKFLEHALKEVGVQHRVRQALMRIEIAMEVPDGTVGILSEVYVREFVCR